MKIFSFFLGCCLEVGGVVVVVVVVVCTGLVARQVIAEKMKICVVGH
jgi:hypothetical protein